MMMDKVVFKTNIPHIVALKYPNGVDAPAQKAGYADQVRFSLVDGRCMFVAPFAADLIAKEGIQVGEEFSIGKFEVRENQTKCVRWKVEKCVPDEPDSQLVADLRRSLANTRARPPQAPAAAPARPAPVRQTPPAVAEAGPVRPVARPAANGGNNAHPESNPRPAPPRAAPAPQRSPVPIHAVPARTAAAPATMPPPSPMPDGARTAKPIPTKVSFEDALTEFLVIAGRATHAAEQRLSAEGASARFDNLNVTSAAITMFIAAKDLGWLTWGGVSK